MPDNHGPGPPDGAPPRPLNVLIDGCNRDLESGTGISTYAKQLARALGALGHSTRWLFGRPALEGSARRASLLGPEAAFDDAPEPSGGLARVAGAAARWRHTLSGRQVSPQALERAGRDDASAGFNAPNLYRLAHHRHAWLGRFTDVAAPPGIDVLHLTAPLAIAMRGVRTVLTIHDLVPILLPWTTPENEGEFARRLRTGVRNADLIVTVSEASKADICRHLDVAPEKVEVTYQCSDMTPLAAYERDALPRILFRFGLEVGRYALFVGAIEPKKNIRRLIDAFLAVDSSMPLAIVGKNAWMWEREIGDLSARYSEAQLQRIRFLGYTPRSDLRCLYAGASFLAFPSLYEGFGLPPLEAMASGCPVLTSHVASLPEVCGKAALYVDPNDPDDMRERLRRMIAEPDLRASLAAAGLIQAQAFSFERYVERLGAAYARLS